jgi:hypothetical protein
MPFPVILGIIALAAAAGGGVAAGASGIADMQKAKELAEAARRRHDSAVRRVKNRRDKVNQTAEKFGATKVEIRRTTIKRMVAILEKLEKKAAQKLKEELASVDVSLTAAVQDFRQQIFDTDLVLKSVGSAVTGAAAGASAYAAIGLLGTASTGTAIGGLSGAAATNATLAWLGGGSLAAGGGGMALGTAVLGGIVVAPALFITGLALAAKGEKALTQARAYEANVATDVAKIGALEDFLQRIETRVDELQKLAEKLNERATAAIRSLEQLRLDSSNVSHVRKFQEAMLLVAALSEVMKVPVLKGDQSTLSIESGRVVMKYRELAV